MAFTAGHCRFGSYRHRGSARVQTDQQRAAKGAGAVNREVLHAVGRHPEHRVTVGVDADQRDAFDEDVGFVRGRHDVGIAIARYPDGQVIGACSEADQQQN